MNFSTHIGVVLGCLLARAGSVTQIFYHHKVLLMNPEYTTLEQCYPRLMTCLQQSPSDIVVQLRPSSILAPSDLEFLRNQYNDCIQKALRIVDVVISQVQNDPKVYSIFIEALKAAGDWTRSTVTELEQTYRTVTASATTSNPSSFKAKESVLCEQKHGTVIQECASSKIAEKSRCASAHTIKDEKHEAFASGYSEEEYGWSHSSTIKNLLSKTPTLETLITLPDIWNVRIPLGILLGIDIKTCEKMCGGSPNNLKAMFKYFLNRPLGPNEDKHIRYVKEEQRHPYVKVFKTTSPSAPEAKKLKRVGHPRLSNEQNQGQNYKIVIDALLKLGKKEAAEYLCTKAGMLIP